MKKLKINTALFLLTMATTSFAQNSDIFIAVTKSGNNGYIAKTSDNGKTITTIWNSEMDAKTGQNRLFDIASGSGKLVAVGNMMLVSNDNGKTWIESNMYHYTGASVFASKSSLACVTYGNGFFVAAAPFHIIYSKDGENWKFVRTDELSTAEKSAKENPSGLSLEDIAKDPKLHGKRPSIGEFPPEITPGLRFPRAITYAQGKFYLTGGNGMMTGKILKIEGDKIVVEKDIAFTGNAAKLNTGGLADIVWDGKNTLVATSISTKSAYSTDMGNTWNYIENPANNQIWGLAYNNGTWIAASPFEDIFTSTDITSGWQTNEKRGGGRAPVTDMDYINGNYILVGNNGAFFISPDGKKWERTSETMYGFNIQGITSLIDREGNTTGSNNTNTSNEWINYNFNNASIATNYTVLVHNNGSVVEKKMSSVEIQTVSTKGSEKIIVSAKKLSGSANKQKVIEGVTNSYKNAAKPGSVKEEQVTYNGLTGTSLSYTSSKTGQLMSTFNAVSDNNQLIIIACVNMSEKNAQTIINSFNLEK